MITNLKAPLIVGGISLAIIMFLGWQLKGAYTKIGRLEENCETRLTEALRLKEAAVKEEQRRIYEDQLANADARAEAANEATRVAVTEKLNALSDAESAIARSQRLRRQIEEMTDAPIAKKCVITPADREHYDSVYKDTDSS